jgi:hypothetical protein
MPFSLANITRIEASIVNERGKKMGFIVKGMTKKWYIFGHPQNYLDLAPAHSKEEALTKFTTYWKKNKRSAIR